MAADQPAHTTVLLKEATDALISDRDGYYVDCTFGRGGHSRQILEALSPVGRLLALDKDPEAVAVAKNLFRDEPRLEIVRGSYTRMKQLLEERGILGKVSGILLDLGVSSPQLNEAGRGFSFSHDGPLDMRMDPDQGSSAAEWLQSVEAPELARVLKTYGDERYAKRIAKAIVRARTTDPIERTHQLAKIIAEAHPAWEPGKHPATRSFLAIRLFINAELEDLETLLEQSIPALRPGGRLAVISFHSLEDRIVKRFIRNKSKGDNLPRHVPVREDQLNKILKPVGKPIKPSRDEVAVNVRSRSAIMRVAEKLGEAA